jgi:FO synthase
VKMGARGVLKSLSAGVNDLGGTLMNESISRAAGASYGQSRNREDFSFLTQRAGRFLEQRTTLYGSHEDSSTIQEREKIVVCGSLHAPTVSAS